MSRKSDGWIGVDLDGTLAYYDHFRGEDHIGAPIPAMVERVKQWLAEGREIRILTARASHPEHSDVTLNTIAKWCLENIGRVLPITCIKDYQMLELYDDRAIQVEKNTGRLVGYSTR